jgi:hypothetical protein
MFMPIHKDDILSSEKSTEILNVSSFCLRIEMFVHGL